MITREHILKYDPVLSGEFTDEQLARINQIIALSTSMRETEQSGHLKNKQVEPFTDHEKWCAGIKIMYKFWQLKGVFTSLFAAHGISASWDVVLRFLVPRVTRQGSNLGLNISTFSFIKQDDGTLIGGKEGWASEQYPTLRRLLIDASIQDMDKLPELAPVIPRLNPSKTTFRWGIRPTKEAADAGVSAAGSSAKTTTAEEPDTAAGPSTETPTVAPAKKKLKILTGPRSSRKRTAEVEDLTQMEDVLPLPTQAAVALDTGIKASSFLPFNQMFSQMVHMKAEIAIENMVHSMKAEMATVRGLSRGIAPSTMQNSNVIMWNNEQLQTLVSKLKPGDPVSTKSTCKEALLEFMRSSLGSFQEENVRSEHAQRFLKSIPNAKRELPLFAIECLRLCD